MVPTHAITPKNANSINFIMGYDSKTYPPPSSQEFLFVFDNLWLLLFATEPNYRIENEDGK